MTRLLDERKEAMKNSIYDAAVEMLTAEGLDAMTMDRVADRAGVAKGSVYNYFHSKKDLVEFVYHRTIAPLEDKVAEIIDAPIAASDKLWEIFRALFLHLSVRRGLFNLFFDQQAFHPMVARPNQDALRHLVRVLQQGVGEGVFRDIDPEFHARLIFGALRGVCDEYVLHEGTWPVEEMADVALDFCVIGMIADDKRSQDR